MTDAVYAEAGAREAIAAPATRQLKHLPILDSVRGVAILLVVIFHGTVFTVDTDQTLRTADSIYLGIASLGWCGVDLFFVLSGFLITRILLHTKNRPKYFRNFYARRTLRIFPLYYAAVFLYLGFSAVFPQRHAGPAAPWLLTYTSNLVFLFDKNFIMPLTVGHFWSLALEEQFYLFWPLLVLVLSRRGLARACVAFVVLALCIRCALVRADNTFAAYRFTFARLDALSLGGAAALLASAPDPIYERGRKWAPRVMLGALLALVGIGIERGNFRPEDPVVTAIGISFLGFFFAAAVFLLVTRAAGRAATGPGHAILSGFGRYSYGMYVFHQPIAVAFIRLKGTRHMPTIAGLQFFSELAFLGLFAVTTLVVAMLSYHLMEKQFLRLKVRFQ